MPSGGKLVSAFTQVLHLKGNCGILNTQALYSHVLVCKWITLSKTFGISPVDILSWQPRHVCCGCSAVLLGHSECFQTDPYREIFFFFLFFFEKEYDPSLEPETVSLKEKSCSEISQELSCCRRTTVKALEELPPKLYYQRITLQPSPTCQLNQPTGTIPKRLIIRNDLFKTCKYKAKG